MLMLLDPKVRRISAFEADAELLRFGLRTAPVDTIDRPSAAGAARNELAQRLFLLDLEQGFSTLGRHFPGLVEPLAAELDNIQHEGSHSRFARAAAPTRPNSHVGAKEPVTTPWLSVLCTECTL